MDQPDDVTKGVDQMPVADRSPSVVEPVEATFVDPDRDTDRTADQISAANGEPLTAEPTGAMFHDLDKDSGNIASGHAQDRASTVSLSSGDDQVVVVDTNSPFQDPDRSNPYVREVIPPPIESVQRSFEGGTYEPEDFQPGDRLYRAEYTTDTGPGHFFSADAASSPDEQDKEYDLYVWDNRCEVLREYEVTQPFTGLVGKVADRDEVEHTGIQIYIPQDVPPADVVRRVDEHEVVWTQQPVLSREFGRIDDPS